MSTAILDKKAGEFKIVDVVPEGHHYLAELGKMGDVKCTWDPTDAEEVEGARIQFEKMTDKPSKGGKGYIAYRSNKDGSSGDRLEKFDPKAAAIILVRPMVGG